MDDMLCDELLQEILTRVSKSSSSSLSVSLVSKRWLNLYRNSKTSLSVKLVHGDSTVSSLATLLSRYPFVSSLSLLFSSDPATATTSFNDHLLFVVSSYCSKLKDLRFLVGPVSLSSLVSLSNTCTLLTSLTINLSRPLFFSWVASFSCLKDLSIHVCDNYGVVDGFYCDRESGSGSEFDAELWVENLSLTGIQRNDVGVGWLWRRCKKLRKLKLKNCGGIGDGGSFCSFIKCMQGLEEVELRTCRSIVDVVLLKMAENCDSLKSLLVYDGACREGLLQFINNCRCNLQKLDLRLPLDLNNYHLMAAAMSFRNLSTLRLQSCCLVSGEGLKALVIAINSGLEEVALINCDVVEKESGLLATLGQNLRQLRKLDLSYNEFLLDKELISMLVSCNYLIELKLRGCKQLTRLTMFSMFRNCKKLQTLDIMQCCRVDTDAIELFIINSPHLTHMQVEENKLSDVARTLASQRFIEVVASFKNS